MRCNIISMTSEDQFREWCDFQTCEIQIVTEKAIWIKEQKIQMLPESPLKATILMDIQNNAVVREFPFEFVSSYGKYVLNNESAMDSDFIMTMYGYVDNPVLAIGDHIYTVKDTIFEGERIVIDSNAGTVTKISKTGLKTNIFNARGKENSVFKKIPPGISNISWPGSYGVDIVVFDERVQPKWSL